MKIYFTCSPSARFSVLKIIALRGSPTSKFSTSMLFNIRASCKSYKYEIMDTNVFKHIFVYCLANVEIVLKQESVKFVGWEKNAKGMFGPKYVDLSNTMDSKK